MVDELISDVLLELVNDFSNDQLIKLKEAILLKSCNYNICKKTYDVSITLDDKNKKALERFGVEKAVKNMSIKTIKQYIVANNTFLTFFNKSYDQITKDDVLFYFAKLKKENKSWNTLRNVKHYLNSFYTWLVDNDMIEKNYIGSIGYIKCEESKKRIITEAEYQILKDTCKNIKELALLEFLWSTGVRIEELIGLKLQDVNFDSGTVCIFAPKTKTYRTVVLKADALKHLQDYRNSLKINSEYLFCNNKGGAISEPYVNRSLLKRLSKDSGLNIRLTTHMFRKTLATNLDCKGCNIKTIAYTLGHKEISTTLRYYIKTNEANMIYDLRKYQ